MRGEKTINKKFFLYPKLEVPKLNLDVKAIVEKIATSLAGMGKIIKVILKFNPAEKTQFLETLNGVRRLLADLQHYETVIYRSLIMKNIKASFKDTLKDLLLDQ